MIPADRYTANNWDVPAVEAAGIAKRGVCEQQGSVALGVLPLFASFFFSSSSVSSRVNTTLICRITHSFFFYCFVLRGL